VNGYAIAAGVCAGVGLFCLALGHRAGSARLLIAGAALIAGAVTLSLDVLAAR
jgi:hypothetical protein